MNLVAKEYVAAQNPEDPGVLILSPFDRRPIEFREATGHVARQRTEPLSQRTVFRNVAARCGGDLQEADVVAVRGIAVEKAGERFEPVLEPLTVIEPVHPNDELASPEALLQPACRSGFHSATG